LNFLLINVGEGFTTCRLEVRGNITEVEGPGGWYMKTNGKGRGRPAI
jgi:hypothetical protein